MAMKLYHTSPNAIEKIEKGKGTFGSHLFFSSSPYYMTEQNDPELYSSEFDEDDIIDARSMFYQENWSQARKTIDEVMEKLNIDEQEAMDLLDESKNIFDMDLGLEGDDMAELAWWLQKMTAHAASEMGYKGVKVRDEQGTAYMIDMYGQEHKLKRENVK